MNPYLAGVLLGLVLLAAIYLSGRGLGASGSYKSVVISTVESIAPAHTESSKFYQEQKASHPEHPLKSWLVFEVLGVLVGAFFSGVMAKRMTFEVEKGPRITSRTRLIMATVGGLLFGLGAMLAGGCTSGAALSGMAVAATSGFVITMAIFGSGYLFSLFFKRFWR